MEILLREMKIKIPECIHKRHRWHRFGYLKENPGVVGIGGSAIMTQEQCIHCGMVRRKVEGDCNVYGNRNHGWRYSEPDEEI